MFELHSKIDKIENNNRTFGFALLKCTADEDSDINPHDFDGTDVEYGTHRNIGQHSFSQMQVMSPNNQENRVSIGRIVANFGFDVR